MKARRIKAEPARHPLLQFPHRATASVTQTFLTIRLVKMLQ